ncbi:MAG: hypothetical protein QNJ75_07015 [Acidimicrobiia bacterium]|nr:hypothetical protein [Acidimicrobiia bacterium]MDJ0664294.1 hypothetical protein [Acidimicrobiia bacterium]
MQHRRVLAHSLALVVLLAACSTDLTDEPGAPSNGGSDSAAAEVTTTTSPFSTTTTTSTIPPRLIPLLESPPAFEEVALLTSDDLELYAKYWPGGPVAVLAGHDFYTTSDADDGVDPQSSDSIVWWTGVLADQGFTVLSPDYRGHGRSPGETSINDAPTDLKAAYDFLVARGYEKIVMAGLLGSGTAGVVLDAQDPDVEFAGIAMIWSAPQELALDAQRVLYGIDAPIYLVSFDNNRIERWSKLMAAEIDHLYDRVMFYPAPDGVDWVQANGEEFVGRLVDFVEYVAAEG